jgi:hypothetical protein
MSTPTNSDFKKDVEFKDGKVTVKSSFFREKSQAERRKLWEARSTCTDEEKESAHYISCQEMAALANNGCDPYQLRAMMEELGTRLYRMKTKASNQTFDKEMDKAICKLIANPDAEVKFTTQIEDKSDGDHYIYSSSEWSSRIKKKADLARDAGILTPEYLAALRKLASKVPRDGRALNGYSASEVDGWNVDTERKLKAQYDEVHDQPDKISDTPSPVRVKEYRRKDGTKVKAHTRSEPNAPDGSAPPPSTSAPPPSTPAPVVKKTVQVDGYTRSNGTRVSGYTRTVSSTPAPAPSPKPTPTRTVQVSGYTRSNGTRVSGYSRTIMPRPSNPSPKPTPSRTVQVAGYTRSNGTHVSGYTRTYSSSSRSSGSSSGRTYVSGYTRANGTKVKGYYRG